MAEPAQHPETEEDTGVGPRRAPRWVVVLGITVAIALVAAMILLHLTGILGPGGH